MGSSLSIRVSLKGSSIWGLFSYLNLKKRGRPDRAWKIAVMVKRPVKHVPAVTVDTLRKLVLLHCCFLVIIFHLSRARLDNNRRS